MADRLDEERLEVLRAWGTGLAIDTRAELRAAGKAIMILIDEIDRLRVEVKQARDERNPSLDGASDGEPRHEPIGSVSSQSLGTSLRERLGVGIPSRAAYSKDD
jgi:hypothetical protein